MTFCKWDNCCTNSRLITFQETWSHQIQGHKWHLLQCKSNLIEMKRERRRERGVRMSFWSLILMSLWSHALAAIQVWPELSDFSIDPVKVKLKESSLSFCLFFTTWSKLQIANGKLLWLVRVSHLNLPWRASPLDFFLISLFLFLSFSLSLSLSTALVALSKSH